MGRWIMELGRETFFDNSAKSGILKNIPAQTETQNMPFMRDQIAVKFTLSENGKKNYRDYLRKQIESGDGETAQFSKKCTDLVFNDGGLEFQPTAKITMGASGLRGKSFYHLSDLIKEYSKVYDEIVQGYQSGERENYIEDANAEYGWRKATLEDELEFLNADFENQLDIYEARERQKPMIMEGLARHAKQLERAFGGRAEIAMRAKEAVFKLKNEPPLPENFKEKMLTAAKAFASQYMTKFFQQGSVDVSKLLSDITTTYLDFLKKDK